MLQEPGKEQTSGKEGVNIFQEREANEKLEFNVRIRTQVSWSNALPTGLQKISCILSSTNLWGNLGCNSLCLLAD